MLESLSLPLTAWLCPTPQKTGAAGIKPANAEILIPSPYRLAMPNTTKNWGSRNRTCGRTLKSLSLPLTAWLCPTPQKTGAAGIEPADER